MSDLGAARRFALSLPGSGEEPQFEATSFRVGGRIFATAPPDGTRLHVFIEVDDVPAYVAEDPRAFEPLLWGQRVRGRARAVPTGPGRGTADAGVAAEGAAAAGG